MQMEEFFQTKNPYRFKVFTKVREQRRKEAGKRAMEIINFSFLEKITQKHTQLC
ncbi:Hypothetical protein Cp262_0353 [Corynebacterium pseudotuberculosis]|nr:Hypothetical protein Cp262_0353 [Corynebacterium pseudotuberculosis]